MKFLKKLNIINNTSLFTISVIFMSIYNIFTIYCKLNNIIISMILGFILTFIIYFSILISFSKLSPQIRFIFLIIALLFTSSIVYLYISCNNSIKIAHFFGIIGITIYIYLINKLSNKKNYDDS